MTAGEDGGRAGRLFIVGTPIGNLGDVTLRAIETLNAVDFIACEDTRVTARLLSSLNVKKPLVCYYKHKEREHSQRITEMLKAGKNGALVTDAGMPCFSDPGAILVSECRRQGIAVETVPGPCAAVTAVALAGIDAKGFVFLGFLPEKKKDRERTVADFAASPLPLVVYSAPHDVNRDAAFLHEALGERRVYAVKELTKIHESAIELNLADFPVEEPRGEYVLIVMPREGGSELNDLTVEEHVLHYMRSGFGKKEAVKRAAADRGVDRNTVYSAVLDL